MSDLVSLPVGWILATFGILGTVIASLAGIIYKSLSARIEQQDKIIKRLQEDIARMSKGCGLTGCHWKNR